MNAMQLFKPALVETSPLQNHDVPPPEPAPGEIRLKVSVCGVCRTDLHIIEGEIPHAKLPVVPGHQTVGTVDKVGAGVTRFRAGDRAGIAWLHETCGQCAFCVSGRENLCPNARFTGLHVDGGYAGYAIARADFAYRIPDTYSDEAVAPLLCAGIIGYRALRLSRIEPGGRIGLYGFGASAHIALQIARHWGCEVYVITRNAAHRALAEELGAAWTGTAEDQLPALLNSAVLFAPSGKLVPPALGALDRGGTLSIAGIYLSPIPELDYRHDLYYERTITSAANNTRRDGEELMALAAEFPIQTHTELFPLAEANNVLQRLKASEVEASAVLKIDD